MLGVFFNLDLAIMVILLFICTCTYAHSLAPNFIGARRAGVMGVAWKASRIGERLSPWVAISCTLMAAYLIIGG